MIDGTPLSPPFCKGGKDEVTRKGKFHKSIISVCNIKLPFLKVERIAK